MKKSVGVVLALVATVLTIGVAFTVQHFTSTAQSSENQERALSDSSSSRRKSDVTSSSQSSSTKAISKKRSNSRQQSQSRADQRETTTSHSKRSKVIAHRSATQASTQRSVTRSSKVKGQSKNKQVTATKPAATKQGNQEDAKTTSHQKTTGQATARLVVSGYKKTIFNKRVAITDKSTVFSVLKASKLNLKYQKGVVVYVSSVNGLAQNDIKTGSGWKYKLNGKFIDKAANRTHVSKNDTVHWYFTTKGY